MAVERYNFIKLTGKKGEADYTYQKESYIFKTTSLSKLKLISQNTREFTDPADQFRLLTSSTNTSAYQNSFTTLRNLHQIFCTLRKIHPENGVCNAL